MILQDAPYRVARHRDNSILEHHAHIVNTPFIFCNSKSLTTGKRKKISYDTADS